MSEHNLAQEIIMNDTVLNKSASFPRWMRVTRSKDLPRKWFVITEAFLKTVELLLLSKPPECAYVNFTEFQEHLHIDFNAQPVLAKRHALLINRSILAYQNMAWAMTNDGILASEAEDIFAMDNATIKALKPKNGGQQSAKNVTTQVSKDGRIEKKVVVFNNLVTEAELEASMASRDSDVRTRFKRIMANLCELGPDRPFRTPVADWQSELDRLTVKFPNFERVISSVIRPHLALSTHPGVEAHRMQPIFLVGSPGCGKTAFTRALQKVFDVPKPLYLVMAAETNGMSLCGSSTFFSNSSPGLLFERLAYPMHGEAPVANPLVIIDEVEKARAKEFDPLAALYSLLEEDTAATFEDQALPGISINASLVRFILLGNEASIPEPMLSRLLTFEIEPLSASQLRRVSQSIFESEVKKLGIAFDHHLPEGVLDQAQGLSLRQCKIRFQAVIGIAVANLKSQVDMASWNSSGTFTNNNRKIGFV
jgi:ATP-dependent Lon protease